MLCIGCLEKRLGRMLDMFDFETVPCNAIPEWHSERLKHRLNRIPEYGDADADQSGTDSGQDLRQRQEDQVGDHRDLQVRPGLHRELQNPWPKRRQRQNPEGSQEQPNADEVVNG